MPRHGRVVDRYAEIHAAHRWDVPRDFNIAEACCGRWAADRARFALYWEDEDGTRAAHDVLRPASSRRTGSSNALAALGVARGDRVALILPQRPETVVAHLAVYQMGAVAVPLSFLFGPDALEYRLAEQRGEGRVRRSAVAAEPRADPRPLPGARARRSASPARASAGVVDVGRSLAARVAAVRRASPRARPTPRSSIYTSGTTGPPKGALMPHACLLGNLPGFVHSHDGFPQPGDLFWSPADWAWTGGLMDALLPTLYFGQPIVGYRGRFDPERAFRLIEKYQVRNTFLFPTALKMMMKALPRPRDALRRRPAHAS